MGIDLDHKHRKNRNRKQPKSNDVYLRLLHRLYKFLARRTGARFNKVVTKRLSMSKANRPPVSMSRIARAMAGKDESKIAVAVATVTDDVRLFEVPKVRVAALRFTAGARARIVKAGGECLSLDQLALQRPRGSNVVLLRGPRNAREAVKHFRNVGDSVKPYTRGHGKTSELARGRRQSRGGKFKFTRV